MKALILANPAAGRGRARDVAIHVREQLLARGWTADVYFSMPPGETQSLGAGRLAIDHGGDANRVIVIGGDGTLREVASAILDRGYAVPVAFIPMGNANVVACELGIPLDTASSLELALASTPPERTIDVGIANGEAFLAMVGTGFDAWVTRAIDRLRRSTLGRIFYQTAFGADLLYGIAGLPAMLRLFPRRAKLTVDNAHGIGEFSSLWVCNMRSYAKGWSVTPAAAPDDGELDYHGVKGAFLLLPLLTMMYARRCRPCPPWLESSGTARELTISSALPIAWQLDGDPMPPVAVLTIHIRAQALRIICGANQ